MFERLDIGRTIDNIACQALYLQSGRQRGYRGHVVSFNQNITSLVRELPRSLNSLSDVVILRPRNVLSTRSDLRVRRERIKNALEFLLQNHKYYRNQIVFSQENLSQLPENATIEEHLQEVEYNPAEDSGEESVESSNPDEQIIADNLEVRLSFFS